MALASYVRMRVLWGLFEGEALKEEPTYVVANTAVAPNEDTHLRRAVLRFARGGNLNDDVIQTSLVLANITDGLPDDSWTGSDYSACETAITAFWTAIKSYYHTDLKFDEIRWYREGPFTEPPEPTVRVASVNQNGTGASGASLPPQISPNISLRSALRKRWGRMYLPPMIESANTTTGRVEPTVVNAIANAADTMLDTFAAADFLWCVYSPTVQMAYGVERIVVDDLWDVIRSRRNRTANVYEERAAA